MARLWASGDAYEPYVGRWSRLVARRFVDWLDLPAGWAWLDVGCGTGAQEARARLRERLRSRLPIRDDGTIHLVASAWAVNGSVG